MIKLKSFKVEKGIILQLFNLSIFQSFNIK